MANRRLYPFWGSLTEGLRTGQPQNEVKSGGRGLFETLYSDPARLKLFLAAMTGLSHGANLAIARAFPWIDYQTYVDVGTAQGDLAAQIALANPHLRGLGFDLPLVQPIFEEYVAASGLSDRVAFARGNFFDDEFPEADVVLMGHILHDWDLPPKRMLIGKAFDAIPAGGALMVYESIIDDDRSKNAFGLMMSLNMLIETPGGFDYTGADCEGWMKDAGFSKTRVEPSWDPTRWSSASNNPREGNRAQKPGSWHRYGHEKADPAAGPRDRCVRQPRAASVWTPLLPAGRRRRRTSPSLATTGASRTSTGKTDADAVFGLMYAQAEDDFNRVETNYLHSQGRSAEADGREPTSGATCG